MSETKGSEEAFSQYVGEWEVALEKLRNLGDVWIGPDIALSTSSVIEPQSVSTVTIELTKDHLPPISVTRGALKNLEWSTRSFYAQTGIDIRFERYLVSDEAIKALESGEKVPIPITIANHGQRAVEVGGDVMRFFWSNFRDRLKGKDLAKRVASGAFGIEGREGEDWFFVDTDGNRVSSTDDSVEKAASVIVRLTPDRFYIPHDTEPVRKDPAQGTRQNLKELLKPIPEGENVSFEIGETPRMRLDAHTVGVIHLNAYDEGELGVAKQGQLHIHSPLIDPGFEGPIRTETLQGMTHVEFFVYDTGTKGE